VPLARWLAAPAPAGWSEEVRAVLEDPSARVRALLDGAALGRWTGWQRRPDRQRAARAVYTLLTLEHWLRRWA